MYAVESDTCLHHRSFSIRCFYRSQATTNLEDAELADLLRR